MHSDSMQFYHFQPLHAQTSGLYCFGCHGNGVPNYTSQCHTDQRKVYVHVVGRMNTNCTLLYLRLASVYIVESCQ